MSRFTPRCNDWAGNALIRSAFRHAMGYRPTQVRGLSGGFNNANYAIDEKLVLRLYAQDAAAAAREAHVLKLAAGVGVRTPEVVAESSFEGRGLLVLSLVSGRILDQEADFADVGAQLALIHSLGFEQWGLFQADGSLETFLPQLGGEMVTSYLDGRAGVRLGPRRVAPVRALEPASLHPRAPTLVHSDFNPKNILVGANGKVTAVLDWEFAMAADPLIDLGNFFRFPEDYEAGAKALFLEGYEDAGGVLTEDWERQAQLHDLVSLLDFLDKKEEYPETFSTALNRLDRVLGLG